VSYFNVHIYLGNCSYNNLCTLVVLLMLIPLYRELESQTSELFTIACVISFLVSFHLPKIVNRIVFNFEIRDSLYNS
jgi:hypothetical protein